MKAEKQEIYIRECGTLAPVNCAEWRSKIACYSYIKNKVVDPIGFMIVMTACIKEKSVTIEAWTRYRVLTIPVEDTL